MNSTSSPAISVIVPVYNTQEYVGECIESILAQDFKDFELILVDDGSTDDSGKICDEYSKTDSRIRVYHQTNGGVTSARKLGVEVSKGEWINFVDSDDTVTGDYLLRLFESSEGYSIVLAMEKEKSVITPEEFRRRCIFVECEVGPWAKLYKRELFYNSIFNIDRKITISEDLLMNIKLSYCAKNKIKLIDDLIYNYRHRTESAVHSFNYNINFIHLFLKEYIASISNKDANKFALGILSHSLYLLCEYLKMNNFKISNRKDNFIVFNNVIRKTRPYTTINLFRYIFKIYILCIFPQILQLYLYIKNE